MYVQIKAIRKSLAILIALHLFGCVPGPLMVSHLAPDQKRMIKRKGASKHYFLSKVVCFDRQCRSFTGYMVRRNKERFEGFKRKGDSFLFRERAPRRDSVITSSDPVDHKDQDRFQLNTPTEFEHANFKTNSAQVEVEFSLELNEFAIYLLENPDYRVHIIGHTDDMGSTDFNLQLSKDRAQSVVDHLINRGIRENRLTPVGMGNTQPLDMESTNEARRSNRRVEFEISSE
ncbi:MAG: OmpA family protein [Cyclobacteriaceae bacterium]